MSSDTSNPSMFLYPYLRRSYVNNSNTQVLDTDATPVIVNTTHILCCSQNQNQKCFYSILTKSISPFIMLTNRLNGLCNILRVAECLHLTCPDVYKLTRMNA